MQGSIIPPCPPAAEPPCRLRPPSGHRRRSPGVLATAALALAPAAATHADIITKQVTPPFWEFDGSWSPEIVPGPSDTARFAAFGAFSQVQLDGSTEVDRLLVQNGFPTFLPSFQGPDGLVITTSSPDPVAPGLEVGGSDDARMTIRRIGIVAQHTVVGPESLRPGSILLDEAESSLDAGIARIGIDGDAGLTLLLGSTVTAESMFAAIGETSTSTVENVGSSLTVNDLLVVGDVGDAVLRTTAGGATTVGRLQVAGHPESDCALWVSDRGSHLVVDGIADLGFRGRATSTVSDAHLQVGGDLILGTWAFTSLPGQPSVESAGDGSLQVTGADALVEVAGDLWIGLVGSGKLHVDSRSRLEVASLLSTIQTGSTAELVIDLSRPAGSGTVISAIDDIDVPTLAVHLAGSAPPRIGAGWKLLEAGGVLTLPSLTLPDLPEDRAWLILQDEQMLRIEVVPTDVSGDITGDGMVDFADLLVVLKSWGPCPDGADCPPDLDGDGSVGLDDLLLVLGGWS